MIISNDKTIVEVQEELLQRLKKERINQGISQEEMAFRSGMSRSSVIKLEKGESVRLVSFLKYLQVLNKLDALNNLIPEPSVKPSDLFGLGKGRQRVARSKKKRVNQNWKWGDEK
jgi:transcriptional regulator with XRE-family HTH domain